MAEMVKLSELGALFLENLIGGFGAGSYHYRSGRVLNALMLPCWYIQHIYFYRVSFPEITICLLIV